MQEITNIWIIEDHAEIRQGMVDLLATLDGSFNVTTFESGEAAISMFAKTENPQMILLDLGLPGLSGVETLVHLKIKNPEIKVLVFTIYEDDAHVFEALKYGASGYILKRENPESILNSIHETLNGGVAMSRDIAVKVLNSFKKNGEDIELNLLSDREMKVLSFLALGKLYKEIADMLYISINTVNTHVKNIYRKLHVQNRSEAIYKYLKSQ